MFDIKYVPFDKSIVIRITFYYNGEPIPQATDTFIISALTDVDDAIKLINDKAYGVKCLLWDEYNTYQFSRITYNVEVGYLSEKIINWRELDINSKTLR